MSAYALTIFTGAFLLFQVQPIIGKYILPWFGGGPGVWTTCMLFFQGVLLTGYCYAHLTTRYLKPRQQAALHLGLLVASLALLPITPADSWKPAGDGNPTVQILLLLGASLGLPYFVLSSTGPLMQQWFTRTNAGVSPYRLYALSNVGSLLALVSYPIVIEPHLTRKTQAAIWGLGLFAYVVSCGICAIRFWKNTIPEVPTTASPIASESFAVRIPFSQQALWLFLPACSSMLLLATTNKLCLDVAVTPFLWIVPLMIYLATFVICFDNPRWYQRVPFTMALIIGMAGVCWVLSAGIYVQLYKQVLAYGTALFACCMVCHGELYRLRPAPLHLTRFYLMSAAGSLTGSLFVAVAAPMIFPDYYELHLGLMLCGLVFVLACALDRQSSGESQWRWLAFLLTLAAFGGIDRALVWLSHQYATIPLRYYSGLRITLGILIAITIGSWMLRLRHLESRHWRLVVCAWLLLGLLPLGAILWKQASLSRDDVIYRSRNFFGVLAIIERWKNEPEDHCYVLRHGRITHGLQFAAPSRAEIPTTYYTKQSGVGLAVQSLPMEERRLGLVGLGAGTMAAYGRPGDYLRFYDINPDVRRLATSRFTFVPRCPATVEIEIGDARLSMEREAPQNFDLLALDAFSSDSIPLHLLTKEAFEVYERHLKTNGIIAIHVTNHYLDLEPVVLNLAHHFKFNYVKISSAGGDWWAYGCDWMLLSRGAAIFDSSAIRGAATPVTTNSVNIPLWTDDFASLFQILR